MTNCESAPRALFGGQLIGSSPVRYVYIDEAGISQHEPARVVAGIVVHPDTQWRAVQRKLSAVYDEFVPPQYRRGFVFHAKHIYGMGKAERDVWDNWKENSRWNLLKSVLSIPMEMRLPIVFGMVRKDSFEEYPAKVQPHDFDHAIAAYYCLAAADEYLRNHTEADEVATVVCEDFEKSKKMINTARKMLEEIPRRSRLDDIILSRAEREAGKIFQSGDYFIEKIIGEIHFESKDGVPLLHIADACSFAFRRFFSGGKDGDRLLLYMLKAPIFLDDYSGPGSNAYFINPPVNGI